MKALFYIICFYFLSACASSTQKIMVGPAQSFCNGISGAKCYQIKKADSLANWETLQGSIKDFNYQPGYTYTLEVYEQKPNNLAAAASNYSLKRVLKKEKQESEIPVGNFVITAFKDKDVTNRKMTMNFTEEGQIHGKGICNRYSGTFTATTQAKIKFSQAATTRMLCKEPALERDFFQSMSAVNSYSLEDEELKLYIDKERVLIASFNKEL